MLRPIIFISLFLTCETLFAQRDATLPKVGQDVTSDSCHPVLKRTVTSLTGFIFDVHPLLWARDQVINNLQKSDTTFNDSLHLRMIYYYNKQGKLIQLITTSTSTAVHFLRTKIYDEQNNLVFRENIYEGNTIMRMRRGYSESSKLLFECAYWREVGRASLVIYPENKKLFDYKKDICNCDF